MMSARRTNAEAIEQFVSGQALMYNLGEWIFESLPVDFADKMDFFLMPSLEPQVAPAEIVHLYGSFMRAGTPYEKKARQLLRYLGSSGSQESNSEALKRTVSHTGVNADSYHAVQRKALKVVEETEHLVPLLEFNTPAPLAQAFLAGMQSFFEDPHEVESILAILEKTRLGLQTH